MKEQLVSHNELTANMGSSTLDVRSTMVQRSTEEQGRTTATQEGTRPAQTATQREERLVAVPAQESASFVDMFNNVVGSQAGREVARAMVEAAGREGRTLTPQQREFAQAMGIMNNMFIGGGAPTTGENWEPENGTDAVSFSEIELGIGDPIADNILDAFNNEVRIGILQRNEKYALQQFSRTIESLVKRINEPGFTGNRDVALKSVDSLKNQELLTLEKSLERERTPEEDRQWKAYDASKRFEKDFGLIIEDERQGMSKEDLRKKHGDSFADFMRRRQELVKRIKDIVLEAPSVEAARFPPLIMEMASKFRETREMLVNEILFKPYTDKTQQGHYEINLYASGHLDELLATLSRRARKSEHKKDREIFEWYQALKTTSRNFWEMNRGLWTGNLEVFSRVAEEMNYDQFETMQRVSGVAETMRLYDEKFMETMARDHRITSENLEEIKREVRDEMIRMNEQGLMKSDYFNDREGDALSRRKLEAWELDRALSVGFVFFNITFRGPELTSIGQLETGDLKFASYPYENATRMLNVIMTAERFEIAEKRGGMKFMERARLINKRIMADDGRHLGVNRFREINGISVDDLEFMSVLGISGIFSGWRMTSAAYEGIEVVLKEGKNRITNLWEYMKERELKYKGEPVNGVQGFIGAIRSDPSLSMEEKQREIVRALDPLIGRDGNLDVGLGMLLKLGMGTQGQGGFLSGEEGFEARKAIWKRVARKNQLITASMLTNLVEDDGSEKGKESTYSLKNLMIRNGWFSRNSEGKMGWEAGGKFIVADFKNTSSPNYYLNNPEWKDLKTKLQIKQETSSKQRQDATDEDRDYMKSVEDSITFSGKEKALLDKITAAGEEVSGDLADIVFPYMIFMNDMPFEKFQWAGPGAQFFKRRIGDIGSYNKSIGAITSMQDNLAGMKPEDVVGKGLKELQRGIESPNGAGSGWTAVLPFAMAYMEMAQTYKGWESQAMVKDVKRMMNKATSELQEYGGVHAPSMDEQTAYAFLHLLRHEGVIDHESEEMMRKYRGLTLFDIFFAFFRDLAPVVVLSMMIDAPKSAINLK